MKTHEDPVLKLPAPPSMDVGKTPPHTALTATLPPAQASAGEALPLGTLRDYYLPAAPLSHEGNKSVSFRSPCQDEDGLSV